MRLARTFGCWMRRQAALSCVFRTAAATQTVMAENFYPAEPAQQNYDQNDPVHHAYCRGCCGRGARLKQLGGDRAGQ